jgi:hypothetical protein
VLCDHRVPGFQLPGRVALQPASHLLVQLAPLGEQRTFVDCVAHQGVPVAETRRATELVGHQQPQLTQQPQVRLQVALLGQQIAEQCDMHRLVHHRHQTR